MVKLEKSLHIVEKITQIIINLFILAPLITFFLAGLGSYLANGGDFFLWIAAIPVYVWIILIIISISILIFKRKQEVDISKHDLQERYSYSPDTEILCQAEYGTYTAANVPYDGILWHIKALNNPSLEMLRGIDKYDSLLIEIPPKCPVCKSDLFERLSFWGGFLWECKRCRFKKRTSLPFLIAASHALAVAKSKIRDDLEKKDKKHLKVG